ncbi:hypothetical protein D7X33_11670 [Butyricicoccus sp. 1XD8-22]|nr:hypothetical protein D7X33_11670 [Butyricicoccus sp. 1XD8-22]
MLPFCWLGRRPRPRSCADSTKGASPFGIPFTAAAGTGRPLRARAPSRQNGGGLERFSAARTVVWIRDF